MEKSLLTTSSTWEATISSDGLLCSVYIDVGFESLQRALIEPTQTTAGSIQVSDQRNDQRHSEGMIIKRLNLRDEMI